MPDAAQAGPQARPPLRLRLRSSIVGLYGTLAVASTSLFISWPITVWHYAYSWPGFNFIRVPARFVVLTLLALAVLTASSFERLTRGCTRRAVHGLDSRARRSPARRGRDPAVQGRIFHARRAGHRPLARHPAGAIRFRGGSGPTNNRTIGAPADRSDASFDGALATHRARLQRDQAATARGVVPRPARISGQGQRGEPPRPWRSLHRRAHRAVRRQRLAGSGGAARSVPSSSGSCMSKVRGGCMNSCPDRICSKQFGEGDWARNDSPGRPEFR